MEDPSALWVRVLFSTLYPLWGFSWALVALAYGKAAYVSWVGARGEWRRAVPDMAAPFVWGLRSWWRQRRGRPHPTYKDKYQPGHLLRYAVFLGALAPALWGFYFVALDRSRWTTAAVTVNVVGVLLSTMAAWLHLWLAYRKKPTTWSTGVLAALTWLVVAPFALHWVML